MLGRKGDTMKKAILALALAAVLAAIPRSSRAADSGAKAAIEKLNQDFAAGWNAHDPKKMAAAWAEDGDLINPFGRKGTGRAAVQKIFEDEHGSVMKTSTFKLESSSVRELGATAAFGDWEILITGMADPEGKSIPDAHYHCAVVYTKTGGHWSIAAGRPYAFLPPPEAPAK